MPKYGVDGWMLQTTSTTIWFVESIAFHEYFEYQTLPLLCLIFVFANQVGLFENFASHKSYQKERKSKALTSISLKNCPKRVKPRSELPNTGT